MLPLSSLQVYEKTLLFFTAQCIFHAFFKSYFKGIIFFSILYSEFSMPWFFFFFAIQSGFFLYKPLIRSLIFSVFQLDMHGYSTGSLLKCLTPTLWTTWGKCIKVFSSSHAFLIWFMPLLSVYTFTLSHL